GGRARGGWRTRAHRPDDGLRHRPADLPREPQTTRRGPSASHGTALSRHGAGASAGAPGPERRSGDRSDRRIALTDTRRSFCTPLAPTSCRYKSDAPTGAGSITLNGPDRLNALTFDVYRELRDGYG